MLVLCSLLVVVVLLASAGFTAAGEGPALPFSADPETIDKLRARVQPVLALSEAELLRLIPERAGLYFVACPNCEGGAQEGQISWSLERPDEVFCRYCGLRYSNDKYPDDKILEVVNPKGETQEYPYWEDETGYRIFFRAKGWFLAREYFAHAALDLASLYAAEKHPDAAHRAALILGRFAEVYPGYCVHYDYPFRQKIIFPGDRGFPYPVPDFRAAKWSWWAYMDIPEDLLRAYDLIRDSGALDSAQQQRIETDLFRASVAFVRSYPPALSNMDPTLLRGLIVAGRVLRDPDYIHDSVDRIGRLVRKQFFRDGAWREGAVSYHNQTVGGLDQLLGLLDGYTDPEGYTHPGDGERYSALDLTDRFPILQKARRVPDLLRYPNGRTMAVHDTWAKEKRKPYTASGPFLLPAVGQARLARGKGPHQVQVHLHFSGGYGHQHADLLGLTLFSGGQERLSDIGYTHTRHRFWALSTLSHNTVTVDGRDQAFGSEKDPSDGDLRLYVPGDGVFQAVEADGDRAYPGRTTAYRRLLLLVGAGPENAYIVDLFRVSGGDRHEYTLLGDADHDGALETDLARTPAGDTLLPEGVAFRLPTGESVEGDAGGHNLAYACIRNVERAIPDGLWTAAFTSRAEPAGAVRVHGFSEPGDALFFGQAPSVRRAGSDDTLLDRFTMPVLLLRREGEDLSGTFVTVLEPVSGDPFLKTVESLVREPDGTTVLKVAWGDRTDYLLSSPDPDRPFRTGDLLLKGRLGFVRERAGTVERMVLVGGTRLEKGDVRLKGRGILSGGIREVLRKAAGDSADAFVVDVDLPAGDRLAGTTVLVEDGAGFTQGCEIADVKKIDGQTILLLADDPGFEIDPDGTSRHSFFPGRTWQGQNRFEIAPVATFTASGL